jgi:ribose transport system permease protein
VTSAGTDTGSSSPTVSEHLQAEKERTLALTERYPGLWVGIVVLITLVVYGIIVPHGHYLTSSNLSSIGLDSSEILIMGTAMTFLLIAGQIDLSIGSALVMSSVAAALVMQHLAGSPEQVKNYIYPHAALAITIGILVALATGTAIGFLNGLLIAYQRLPAFIVTLGTAGVFLGVAEVATGGQNAPYVPPSLQTHFGAYYVGGFPVPLALAFLVAFVGWVVLSRTRSGVYTYAIGANQQAARRSGIAVRRHVLMLYVASGLCAGIAAVIDLARFTSTSLEGHQSDMLLAIAAVVLGGTSLFGGVGGMGGTIIAVFFPSLLYNGFIQMGLQPFWQGVVLGLVLIAAVWIDALRRQRLQGGDQEE